MIKLASCVRCGVARFDSEPRDWPLCGRCAAREALCDPHPKRLPAATLASLRQYLANNSASQIATELLTDKAGIRKLQSILAEPRPFVSRGPRGANWETRLTERWAERAR